MTGKWKTIAACAFLGTLFSGCVAYRQPLAVSPQYRTILSTNVLTQSAITLRRPAIGDGLSQFPEWHDQQFELELRTGMTDNLIRQLRLTKLFPEVGYLDEIVSDSYIEIEPIQGPPHKGVDGQNFCITAFYLGILPVVEEWQDGIYFRLAGRNLPTFRCDWPVIKMTGWIAGPFKLHRDWQSEPDEDAFLYSLRKSLIEQKDLFTQ